MLPLILPRSRLYVAPVFDQRVSVGDVVCFPSAHGKVVGHRVVAIATDSLGRRQLVVRGDSQEVTEQIAETAVAYRVVRVNWRGPLSYDCDGPLGRALSKLALHAPGVVRSVAKLMIGAAAVRRRIVGHVRGSTRAVVGEKKETWRR